MPRRQFRRLLRRCCGASTAHRSRTRDLWQCRLPPLTLELLLVLINTSESHFDVYEVKPRLLFPASRIDLLQVM